MTPEETNLFGSDTAPTNDAASAADVRHDASGSYGT
jgi:hypothetical protein